MAGPFRQGPLLPAATQSHFHRLKPVCVELLSLVGRSNAPAHTAQLVTCLRHLKFTLQTLISESASSSRHSTLQSRADAVEASSSTSRWVEHGQAPLPSTLVNYVFYPVSELIRTAPKGISSLSDSVAENVLEVLALLASQWWATWSSRQEATASPASSRWQTWCDLVILASSAMGDAPNAAKKGVRASDEVKLAALRVLTELLSARFETAAPTSLGVGAATERNAAEWEWDGVSDLTLLDDDVDASTLADNSVAGDAATESAVLEPKLLFPTPEHLAYAAADKVARGAVSFVLSTAFAVAESSAESIDARTAAMAVARSALLVWIGGVCLLPDVSQDAANLDPAPLYCITSAQSGAESTDGDAARKAAGLRLRPLLPGITSSLTRIATSRVKTKQDGAKPKPTPAPVAAAAITMLGDLLRGTVADVCLSQTMNDHAVGGRAESSSTCNPSAFAHVTDLTEFAEANMLDTEDETVATEKDEAAAMSDAAADSNAPTPMKDEAKWALSTLAQIQLALRTFSPLTQPSLPGTSLPSSVSAVAQKAVVRLAVALLSDCGASLAWLDDHLEGMARLDGRSVYTDAGREEGTACINTLLTWIIDLASESNSTSVAECAKLAFGVLQTASAADGPARRLPHLTNGPAFGSLMMHALDALPAAVTAQNEAAVSRLTLRVTTLLDLIFARTEELGGTVSDAARTVALAQLVTELPPRVLRLAALLRTERLDFVDEQREAAGLQAGWRLQPAFAGLEASTSRQLSRMFFQLGRTLALAFVQDYKARQPGTKGEQDVFAIVPLLVERAAQLRSVRLPATSSGVGGDRAGSVDAMRRAESLTSLALAADVLAGVSSWIDNIELGVRLAGMAQASRQARKVAHRLGKKVFGLVMDMLDGDAEEAVAGRSMSHGDLVRSSPADVSTTSEKTGEGLDMINQQQSLGEASQLVERVKGISLMSDDIESTTPARHGPALDLGFVRAANMAKSTSVTETRAQQQLAMQHRYVQAERSVDLSNALAFALVSASSKLLGHKFRSLLLRGSYTLISGMSATSTVDSDLVRRASTAAMQDVAFNTAYGDVKNCLLDHADYILGSACQRLISGLDEELRAIASASSTGTTPAIGRGDGGKEMNGNTHRVVLPLVAAQRAPFVLVQMIRVLGSEIVPMVEDAIDEVLDALDRFHAHPSICGGLLAVLDSILETMAAEQAARRSSKYGSKLLSTQSSATQTEAEDLEAWLALRRRDQPAFDEGSGDESGGKKATEDQEDKPSKSQQVAEQILAKAAAFLTHPSAVLRSHVLALLRHGVETLAPQGRTAELLPIVNNAWPYVMTRLGASYSSGGGAARGAQLTPIIDLDRTAVGAANRAQSDAVFAQIEAALVEKEPQVWVAAARFVEAAAEHVPEFVGKRIVEEAWPRFDQLLMLLRWKFHPRSTRGRASEPAKRHAVGLIQDLESTPRPQRRESAVHTHSQPPFILPSPTSVPAQLTLTIVTTLISVVRHVGTRLPDDAAWSMTSHPFLLDLLDARQPPALCKAAEVLYVELGRRNPPATAWALQTAFPQPAARAMRSTVPTPCFLAHTHTAVHAETLHHIVASFATA